MHASNTRSSEPGLKWRSSTRENPRATEPRVNKLPLIAMLGKFHLRKAGNLCVPVAVCNSGIPGPDAQRGLQACRSSCVEFRHHIAEKQNVLCSKAKFTRDPLITGRFVFRPTRRVVVSTKVI